MWFGLEYLDQALLYIKVSWLIASYRVSLHIMHKVLRYLISDVIALMKFFSLLLSFLMNCIIMSMFSSFMPI